MNKDLPHIILKLAVTKDGFLDDQSQSRLIISCPTDQQAVQNLRGTVDGIMVGANTVRKDNPKLTAHDSFSKQPTRIIISASGHLPLKSNIFDGLTKTIICSNNFKNFEKNQKLLTIPIKKNLADLFIDLKTLGLNSILVEGGLNLVTQLIDQSLFDQFRLAISPSALNAEASSLPRFDFSKLQKLKIIKSEKVGLMNVVWYEK